MICVIPVHPKKYSRICSLLDRNVKQNYPKVYFIQHHFIKFWKYCISWMISSFESSIKSFGTCFLNLTTTRKKKHRYEGKQQIAWLVSRPCLLVSLGAMVDFLREFHPISAIQLITFEYFSPWRQLSCIRRNIVRIVWKAHPGQQYYVSPLLKK